MCPCLADSTIGHLWPSLFVAVATNLATEAFTRIELAYVAESKRGYPLTPGMGRHPWGKPGKHNEGLKVEE